MKLKNTLKRNSGFSVIEVLVTAAISTMVMGFGYYIANDLQKQSQKMMDILTGQADDIPGDRLLTKLLRVTGQSFNKLKVLDDNSKNFYDYYSDVTDSFIVDNSVGVKPTLQDIETCNATGSVVCRVITMTKDNLKDVYFIQNADSTGTLKMLDPVRAYQQTVVGMGSTLSYRGLNYNNYLSHATAGVAPENYKALQLFLLVNPAVEREAPSRFPIAAATEMLKIPRTDSILGYFDASMAEKVVDKTVIPVIQSHPEAGFEFTGSLPAGFASPFDLYLRTLSMVGGAEPKVLFVPVKVIKIFAEIKNASKGTIDIFVSELNKESANKWSGKRLIYGDVKALRFYRASVASAKMSFSVERFK